MSGAIPYSTMSSWSLQVFTFMCVMAAPLISLDVFYKPENQASFF